MVSAIRHFGITNIGSASAYSNEHLITTITYGWLFVLFELGIFSSLIPFSDAFLLIFWVFRNILEPLIEDGFKKISNIYGNS